MQNEKVATVVRFGSFELDPRSGELWTDGRKVPLQEQPFLILTLLTNRPGEIVTREEIRSSLWPDDTVVEFENAVNAAIKKLRMALGDSAEEPRYIETLRRRGYRLMVPVERVATATEAQPTVESALQPPPTSMATRWKMVWCALAVGILLMFGYGYWRHLGRGATGRSKLTERDSIVVGDFSNKTNEAVFSETLRQGLTVQLSQSPFLNLVGEDRIAQVLQLMGQPADTPLTPSVAWEVCQRAGSSAVLDGSITSLGSEYVLWLRARSCRTGEVIDVEQMQAARKEDVLNTLSRIASRFRGRMGESFATLGRLDTPLAEATTPSLEALKEYSMAWKVLSSNGSMAAVPLYKRAAEIDPQFAMAYAMLGRVYGDIGENALASESTTKAWQLRDRANDRERFFIDASYQIQVTGNLEKAERTCEAWKETYPREARVRGFLAGMIYPVLGKYEAAQQEARKMVELDPDFAVGYSLVALTSVPLGRIGEAGEALAQARKRGLEVPDFLMDQYQFAFLTGDRPAMERLAALGAKTSGAEDSMAAQHSFTAAYSGHLAEARGGSDLAVRLAEQTGQHDRAAAFEAGAAVREAFFGNAPAAKARAAAAQKLSRSRDIIYGVAFALAVAGDSASAQKLVDALEKQLPEDTSVRFDYVPVVRAMLAIKHGEPAAALEVLRLASPYELGQPQSSFTGFYGVLYPAYVRGEAYLALGQGSLAVAEFRNILEHRNVVVNDPVGALALVELGKAYTMAGENAKAKTAYEDFLSLWQDADADIPVLRRARAEYAGLR